jgi:4-oxalocrotonate tautomerase
MPLIEVHLIENVFDLAQKRQIIQKLTDAMVSVEGENMRGVTWVKNLRSDERRMGHRRPAADPPKPSRISQPDDRRR